MNSCRIVPPASSPANDPSSGRTKLELWLRFRQMIFVGSIIINSSCARTPRETDEVTAPNSLFDVIELLYRHSAHRDRITTLRALSLDVQSVCASQRAANTRETAAAANRLALAICVMPGARTLIIASSTQTRQEIVPNRSVRGSRRATDACRAHPRPPYTFHRFDARRGGFIRAAIFF